VIKTQIIALNGGIGQEFKAKPFMAIAIFSENVSTAVLRSTLPNE